MFKLLSRLFGRKPPAVTPIVKHAPPVLAPRGTVSNPSRAARSESIRPSTVSQPNRDDIYTNPLHPLNPTSQAIYSASDDTPSRSHCSGYSSSSSSSDSSSCSSSDSSSSSSSSD